MGDGPKILCVASGREVDLTPEEEVRQLLVLRLMGLGYRRDEMIVNFTARFGSQAKYLDIGVFRRDVEIGDRYVQQNVFLIVECKRRGIPPKMFDDARVQLESYMAACLNASYGIVTDGERTTVVRKDYRRIDGGSRGALEFIEIAEIPRPEEAEAFSATIAPASADNIHAPAPALPAPIKLVAVIPADGRVSLPEGTFRFGEEHRKANPPQCICLEGGVTYWCYEGEVYVAAMEGMTSTELGVRVAHFAETERARQRTIDESKSMELAALAAEAELLRRGRAEAYARSPEGIAAAQAERARAEADEILLREVEEEAARRLAEDRRRELQRQQERKERFEKRREEEQRARWAEEERRRKAEETRKDAENPGWREERAKLERDVRSQELRAIVVGLLVWIGLPIVAVVACFIRFGLWIGLSSMIVCGAFSWWAANRT